jgi:pyruvate dehydrogenase complex dehydrogenase (E1) component
MLHDIESQEWLDALSSLVKHAGKERASEILQQLS